MVPSASEASAELSQGPSTPPPGVPLVCVEILGRSIVGRIIDELQASGVETISLLADCSYASARDDIAQGTADQVVSWEEDIGSAASQMLSAYKERGIKAVFVIRAGAYVEVDLQDVLQLHRDRGQAVTRAIAEDGPLDIWIMDLTGAAECDVLTALQTTEHSHYSVRGYVNRLEHPQDLRRLVADSLNARCRLRPHSLETRPGVWIHEGAKVHRGARIVAPAFIGRGSTIEEQCLITRCSNVESNCHIDYGTVVEDSTILSNSYVGIGLDISHSIVNGTSVLNLQRNVLVDIADPAVIRQNRAPHSESPRPIACGAEGIIFAPGEKGVN